MAMNVSGDIKTLLVSDSESKRDEVSPELTAGNNLGVKAWEEWKARGKGSARPLWWLLFLGVLTLSAVY
jgi:hypothetical protein